MFLVFCVCFCLHYSLALPVWFISVKFVLSSRLCCFHSCDTMNIFISEPSLSVVRKCGLQDSGASLWVGGAEAPWACTPLGPDLLESQHYLPSLLPI